MRYLIIENEVITNIIIGEMGGAVKADGQFEDAQIGDEVIAGKLIKNSRVALTNMENRILNYGDFGTQLGELYDDFEAWKERIAMIKKDFPKE